MNWIEVFKTGKHIDSAGNQREWKEEDLDKIVALYTNQPAEERHDAPVVVGHPESNKPAYAWVEAIKRQGNVLLAKFRDIDEKFAELVNAKRYGKISIALYPNLMLRHIGFLGATPPAVKGLKAPEFNAESEYSEIEIEFSEEKKIEKPNLNNNKQFENPNGGNMDEFIKALVEYARKTFNEEIANQLSAEAQKLKGSFKAPDKDKKDFNESPEYIELQKQLQNLQRTLKEQEQSFQEKSDKQKKEVQEMKFNEFFNAKVREGRLVPKQKELFKQLYFMTIEKDDSLEYGEGSEKKTIKVNQLLDELVSTFEKRVEYGEGAKDEPINPDEFAEQNKFIDEYYGVKR